LTTARSGSSPTTIADSDRDRGRFWNGVGSMPYTVAPDRRGRMVARHHELPRVSIMAITHQSRLPLGLVLRDHRDLVSGIYLSMPTPFMTAVNWLSARNDAILQRRSIWVEWMVRLLSLAQPHAQSRLGDHGLIPSACS
jgi:hypothetical protein